MVSPLGAGMMLALHADHVVAAAHASLALPEIDLGIATYVGHALVANSVCSAVADQLALTGRHMGASEALACRLVHAVVPGGESKILYSTSEGRTSTRRGPFSCGRFQLKRRRTRRGSQHVQI